MLDWTVIIPTFLTAAIVAAFGLHGRAWTSSAGGALAALVVVIAAGLMVRAPLQRVQENAIKFAVGAMITAFGTFWTLEAVMGDWPSSTDWSLLGFAFFYGLGGLLLTAVLRKQSTAGVFAMNAFLKTLFGSPKTIAVVAMVVAAEMALVAYGQKASAALLIPVLVLAGTAWLAMN